MLAKSALAAAAVAAVVVPALAEAGRTKYLLDADWKFELVGAPPPGPLPACAPNAFPRNLDGIQCHGLSQVAAQSQDACERACCNDDACEVYQWCNTTNCMPSAMAACWIGKANQCSSKSPGWVSGARTAAAPTPPGPAGVPPEATPGFADSSWRTLNLPHDFVVENTFSESGDKSHGYLPYGKGWYRKHLTIPSSAKGQTIWLEFDGTQANSAVYLNGVSLGGHDSGYTPYRFMLNSSIVNFGAENVLAVFIDATHPDGWWYDGGGIYRHVWMTVAATTHVVPWGVYTPSMVSGAIKGTPATGLSADSMVMPEVEVGNQGASSVSTVVSVVVISPSGITAGTSKSQAVSIAPGANTTVSLGQISLPAAQLWHTGVFNGTEQPLYTLVTTVSVSGSVVDVVNTTFGIRKTAWSAMTGFSLNGIPMKIKGNANHQDFAGLGVAIPDHLQEYRISKLQEMNANGWRTAHNVPNEALLDAADRRGFLVWDENHRNGQDSECEILIRRDRNHPSVVIWSLCNEVLCNTQNITGDMLRLKALIKSLDPLGGRPVSANNNGVNGANTPLDLQGFDYNTGSYDNWHARAPNIPAISSETSSAVSDRDTIANDKDNGRVSQYDDAKHGNTVPWGQSAEGAWGGVGQKNGQGILTRPFISGGFTWTGWDYKGEPTPYAWPDINSHFGIIDEAGFPKDRYFWYQAWFGEPDPPVLHVFPHWNQAPGTNIDIWAFSNADEVELFVNGKSLGRQPSGNYSHAEWPQVPYESGNIKAIAYAKGGSTPLATMTRKTAGVPSSIKATIKDGIGSKLSAGCQDLALVQVFVLDDAGEVVPTANNNVTFTVSGPGTYVGGGNGDPACHVHDKSETRPAFAGKLLGIVMENGTAGTITVTATADGLGSSSVSIDVETPTVPTWWCRDGPSL